MTTFQICAISDTHEKHEVLSIPKCDFLLCAGDITFTGDLEKVAGFCEWMKKQPARHKALCFGNHELSADPSHPLRPLVINMVKQAGIHYLEDSGVEIEGLKIFGSPWTKKFFDWAFMIPPGKEKEKWKAIPDDTHIVLCHQPPFGFGDETLRGDKIGCPELRKRIESLPNLKANVFGHNHAGYGHLIRYFGENKDRRVHLVNASINTEAYLPTNKPICFEVEI